MIYTTHTGAIAACEVRVYVRNLQTIVIVVNPRQGIGIAAELGILAHYLRNELDIAFTHLVEYYPGYREPEIFRLACPVWDGPELIELEIGRATRADVERLIGGDLTPP
jgi:hypothetical protein